MKRGWEARKHVKAMEAEELERKKRVAKEPFYSFAATRPSTALVATHDTKYKRRRSAVLRDAIRAHTADAIVEKISWFPSTMPNYSTSENRISRPSSALFSNGIRREKSIERGSVSRTAPSAPMAISWATVEEKIRSRSSSTTSHRSIYDQKSYAKYKPEML
jgi:hypothetical protein